MTALAAEAGLNLYPWQSYVLENGLGERPGGDWASFEAACIVPRQNGKGAVIEALCLGAMFLFRERLTIYSAHEFKTAQETFRRIDELIAGTDWLAKQVKRRVTSTNELGFELVENRRLRFLARSKGSGRGFSANRLIFDEAYDLPAMALGAIIPTLSAQPNPQVWYFSSAGQVDSEVLRSLRSRGTEGAGRLAYFEWSAVEGCDPDDRDAWFQANPSMGYRISERFIEDEQESLKVDPSEFARERLGVWDDPFGTVGGLPLATWLRLVDATVPYESLTPLVLSVDMAVDHSQTSIGAAGRRPDGLAQVAVVASATGSSWVPARVAELAGKYHPAKVVIDVRSPAWTLADAIRDAGVDVSPVDTVEVVEGCSGFFNAVVAETPTLRHYGDPVLEAAIRGAAQRPVGDRWAWSRKNSTADITPLVAVTNALHALADPSEPWGFFS